MKYVKHLILDQRNKMNHRFAICFVLALFSLASFAQITPNQITRFIILDGWDDTLVGITHDLKTSPFFYDTSESKDEASSNRILQQLAPENFLKNDISSYGSLSFDYDSDNKVAYFGSSGKYTLFKINTDGSGFEAAFASEYVFVKHLNIDFENNIAYFCAYSLAYVNRTAILTTDYFSFYSDTDSTKEGYVVVKANLINGETEELFYSASWSQALVFNSKFNLMFLVDYSDIFVMTMDKTVVDVVPLPSSVIINEATVLYDRKEDVIYVVDNGIFYLRYETQQSGFIPVYSTTATSGFAWHDAENKDFYFMAAGSSAIVYYLGYEDFDALISKPSYVATSMFTLTESTYGIFAVACDSASVSDCGWNSSGMPAYLVILIVLTIILPCAGCAGLIAALCNRKVLEFPEDRWADMPLNQDPDNNPMN